jgi:CxxC motif-containing protein (DUF1111 family)
MIACVSSEGVLHLRVLGVNEGLVEGTRVRLQRPHIVIEHNHLGLMDTQTHMCVGVNYWPNFGKKMLNKKNKQQKKP